MKQGTLEDRTWSETEVTEPAVKNHIKVKINFKDVSVTINIIPNNEYSLGYECAGVIQRLGPAVKKFHIGDRVLDTESCVTIRANNSALQAVLTYSATGGIGIACIELARHRKAEDTSYESIIQEQYQNTIFAKVEGTWNLHNALKSCGSNL
ncbi:Alcohol dehydrogenase GroES domain protein [Aspergillus oryzae]|uniref:Alcohol dehydrogenase GroES domain protein n=1 Tax=Aspergillus oryzae TaxID=5062 RepID=A0A1S9D4J1_ASPOZ|nr:Alcohol dehydrogenase GroES domain protein [Aspergillus oryzae]